jgi:hypothetical protein
VNGAERDGIEAVKFQLRALEAKVDLLLERDANRSESLKDHETRVRSLERWKAALPVTMLGILAAVIVRIATQ